MLSQFCIRRPIFATVLSIIIVLAGLLTLRVLPLSQYPNISPPSVMISTTYEGADSQTIARTVAAPIEDQLSGIEGLLYYTSSIRSNGDIRIQCVFDVGTDANDAMLEINNRVRTAERRLPDRVRNEGVRVRKRNNDTLLMMAMWSPDGSYAATDIADYANLNIVDELKRIPGIGDVSVFGNAQSAMRIWLDPDRMGALGVTVKDVNDAIETQNAQRTAGRVGVAPTIPEQQLFYTVRTPGQLLTPEQFANVIVRADGPNGIVRLRDIAATEVGKRSYEFRVDINGAPGVNVGVYLQTGANAVAAAELVKAKVAELATHYPKGKIAHLITDDTTVFVEASLTEVYRTLAEAGFLVLLVVFVFLQSWRATLIPIIAVPVSLIGTMAGLWLLDFSLNTLTLFCHDAFDRHRGGRRHRRSGKRRAHHAHRRTRALRSLAKGDEGSRRGLGRDRSRPEFRLHSRRVPGRDRGRTLPTVRRDGVGRRHSLGLCGAYAHARALRDLFEAPRRRRKRNFFFYENSIQGPRGAHDAVSPARAPRAQAPRRHGRAPRCRDGGRLADDPAHSDLLHPDGRPGDRAHGPAVARRRGLPENGKGGRRTLRKRSVRTKPSEAS